MPRLLTRKRMRKRRTMIRAYVRGVAKEFPIKEGGVQSTAETNIPNTQNKRRKFVQNAKLQGFESWQLKIFAKNAKQGVVFFRPDAFEKPTPRSSYEAWRGTYHSEDRTIKDERITNRIMFGLFVAFVIALSII